MSAYPVRVIEPDELEAWFAAMSTAFFPWPSDPPTAARIRAGVIDLTRLRAAYDGDAIAGTFRSFGSEVTVPGGAAIPVSAITAVSVRPTHRRRGILGSMMAADIRASVDADEAGAILIAAEWPIYGRFGFGPATQYASFAVRSRQARMRGEASGSVELLGPAAALEHVAALREAHRARRAGAIAMPAYSPRIDLGLQDWAPNPMWKGYVAVHRDETGRPDAFVRYHGQDNWPEGIPDNVLIVDELLGATEAGERELWRYLLSVDLVATMKAEGRPVDEPLPWWLEDARAAWVTARNDHLWVRLHDVPRALEARTYDRDGRLVLEVRDGIAGETGPATGRYALEVEAGRARCTRTTASADLTIAAGALGAAYLGGTRMSDAVRLAGADEHTPGALATADRLFATVAQPWCQTWF